MSVIAVVGDAPCQCFSPGRKPDHVTGTDLLDGAAFALNPAAAGRNDERLAERMRVPGRSSRRLKRHAGALNEGGIGRLEKRVDANGARVPVRRPVRGWLRASP